MKITCKQAVDYIAKDEEQKLTMFQRFQLKWHLASCYLCRFFQHQNNIMNEGLKEHQHPEEEAVSLTDTEKQHIIEKLQQKG